MRAECPKCKSNSIWSDSHDIRGVCNSCGYSSSSSDFEVLDKKELAKKRKSEIKYAQYKFEEYEREHAWAIVKSLANSAPIQFDKLRNKAWKLLDKRPK